MNHHNSRELRRNILSRELRTLDFLLVIAIKWFAPNISRRDSFHKKPIKPFRYLLFEKQAKDLSLPAP